MRFDRRTFTFIGGFDASAELLLVNAQKRREEFLVRLPHIVSRDFFLMVHHFAGWHLTGGVFVGSFFLRAEGFLFLFAAGRGADFVSAFACAPARCGFA
jgi:hypothetical protein